MQHSLEIHPNSRGFYLITHEIKSAIRDLPQHGLLNVFLHHTSAALTINENADPSVIKDLENFTNKLIPENLPYFEHNYEGPDDMPAHVKSTIYGCQVNIPITNGKLNLGTWQGIYLCEFRNNPTSRKLTITVLSSQ